MAKKSIKSRGHKSKGKVGTNKKFKSPRQNNPVFCFQYLSKGEYGLKKCDNADKAQLLEQLCRLGSLTWNDIDTTSRKGLGYEKIPVNQIKPDKPKFLTPEVTSLLAFRFNGNKPFLGIRLGYTLSVLFIDHNFTLYDHGS